MNKTRKHDNVRCNVYLIHRESQNIWVSVVDREMVVGSAMVGELYEQVMVVSLSGFDRNGENKKFGGVCY